MRKGKMLRKILAIAILLVVIGSMLGGLSSTANVIVSTADAYAASSYNAQAAVSYADTWWDGRNSNNPNTCDPYQDYSSRGGDCANFVSQCLIAGGLDLSAGTVDSCGCIVSCTALHNYLANHLGATYETRTESQGEPRWFAAGDLAIFPTPKHAVFAVTGDANHDNDATCKAHSPDENQPIQRFFDKWGWDSCTYYHIPTSSVQPRVKGIDAGISQAKGMDWHEVYDTGYRFALLKATEGINWPSPENRPDLYNTVKENVRGARDAGLLVGVYHFARPIDKDGNPRNEAKDEAESFVRLAGDYLKEGYLRPVLDIEDNDYGEHPELLGKEELAQWIKDWMDTVEARTRIKPILYMNPYLFEFLSDSSIADQYDIWLWDYRSTEPPADDIPDAKGWSTWAFWQYKWNVNLAGGVADLDLFNGGISELEKKFVITPAEEQPKPVPTSASDIVLVMDVSGSMDWMWGGEQKLTSAKEAAKALIGSISSGSRVAVTTFADTAQTSVGLTSDFSVTRVGIEELHAGGDTNIGDALTKALDELETASETGAKKAIVFFTDGHITTGLGEDEVLAGPVSEAVDRQIAIHAIGYGDPSYLHDEFLKKMAETTGGKYYPATKAFQLQNVFIEAGQTAEGWEIEATFTGSVKYQETVIAGEFDLASRPESLKVILNWPGSDLDLKIFDPRGKELDYLAPAITYSGDVKPEYVVIKRPFPGTWTAKVHGKTVASPTEYCLWMTTYTIPHTSSSFIQFIPVAVTIALLLFIVGYFARRSIGKKV